MAAGQPYGQVRLGAAGGGTGWGERAANAGLLQHLWDCCWSLGGGTQSAAPPLHPLPSLLALRLLGSSRAVTRLLPDLGGSLPAEPPAFANSAAAGWLRQPWLLARGCGGSRVLEQLRAPRWCVEAVRCSLSLAAALQPLEELFSPFLSSQYGLVPARTEQRGHRPPGAALVPCRLAELLQWAPGAAGSPSLSILRWGRTSPTAQGRGVLPAGEGEPRGWVRTRKLGLGYLPGSLSGVPEPVLSPFLQKLSGVGL